MAPKKRIVKRVVKKVACSAATAGGSPSPAGTLTPAVAEREPPSAVDDSPSITPEEAKAEEAQAKPMKVEEAEATTPVVYEEKDQVKVNEATLPEKEEGKAEETKEVATAVEKEEEKTGEAKEAVTPVEVKAEVGASGSGVVAKKKVVKKVVRKVKKVKKVEALKTAPVEAKVEAEAVKTEANVEEPEVVAKRMEDVEIKVEDGKVEPMEVQEEANVAPVETEAKVEVEKAEETNTAPMEMEEPAVDEGGVAVVEKSEAKPGRKLVKKVRKVKKVIVRKVPKVKELPKEPAVGESERDDVEMNGSTEKGGGVAEKKMEDGDGGGGGDGNEEVGGEERVEVEGEAGIGSQESVEMSERRKRRMAEIFIGGLARTAKEEDVRKVFAKVGEIVEVRMMMDAKSGKNKGYAFLRYATAAQARRAVEEFNKVEICGKLCGASAIEGNDTIFVGNIDKKWKKEDVIKLLKDAGIEKIDTVTVMPDPKNTNINRGFAFLELETNRDAQLAYKKLQKKGAFGVHKNIKVSWATPLNEPDEEDMQKVKSVYVEGIPSTWSEERVRKRFGKFGEIERVVLSRNIQSAKRKDFAFVNYTTREAALSCIESFDKEASENGSKADIKVSLAKPVLKAKPNKGTSKSVKKVIAKERPKDALMNEKASASISNMRQPVKRDYPNATMEGKSSTTVELLHVLREQASWKQGQMAYAPGGGSTASDSLYASRGEKRPYSSLGEPARYSDPRSFTRARLDTSYASAASLPPSSSTGAPPSYFQRAIAQYGAGASYSSNSAASVQGRYGTPYAGSHYGRY